MSNMSKSDPNMVIKTDYSKARSQFRERLKSLVNSEKNVLWAELPEVINSGVLASEEEMELGDCKDLIASEVEMELGDCKDLIASEVEMELGDCKDLIASEVGMELGDCKDLIASEVGMELGDCKDLIASEVGMELGDCKDLIASKVGMELAIMDENHVKIEELKFQVITSEMAFNMELPELINLAKRSVSWDDPLPSFNRRIISVAVEKVHPAEIRTSISPSSVVELNTTSALANYDTEVVKRCSDSLLGELELYWQQKLTLEGLYQIFLEHRQQLQAYITYSSHLEELRTVFSSAIGRNSNLKVAVFSSKYKLERALLPLHRLQTIRCLLQQIRLVLDASSNNHVEHFRCKRMLTDITQLLDESYKILMLQNGLEYVQKLEKLITTSVQPLNEHSCLQNNLSSNNRTIFSSSSSNTLDSTLRSHKKVSEKEPEHFKTWSRTRCLNKLPPTPQTLTEQQTSIIPTATSRLQVQTMSTQGEVQQTSKIREVKHSAGLFQRLKRSTSISSTQSSTSSASFLTSDDNTSLQVISGARDLSLKNVTSEKKIENIRTKMESDKNNITLEFSHMAHTKLRNSFFSFQHGDKIGDINDDKALVSKFQAADLLSNRLGELSLKSTRQDSSNTRDSFSFNSQLKATQDSTLKLENHLSNSLKVSSQKQTAHFNSHSTSEGDHRFSESSMETAYQFETKTVHEEHSSAQLTEEMSRRLFSNPADSPSSLTIVELDSNEIKQEESLHKEPPPEINHAINSLVLSLHKDTTFKPLTSSSPIITEVDDDESKGEHQEKEDLKQTFQTSLPLTNVSNMSSIAHGDGYEEVNSSSASYQHMAHNTPNSSVSYTSATLFTQHKVSRCQIFRTSFEEAPLYQHYIFSSLSSQTSDDTSPIISEPSSEYGELENHIYEEISSVAPELPPRPNNMSTLLHPKRLGNQHIRWCESEDVINSGILDGLTKKERLFQESKFEIVTSEMSYLKSLCILENVFVQSPVLSQLSVFSEENKTLLFNNVKMVKECSEHFVQALMGEWENDLKLGKMSDLLHQFATSEFKIYVDYCTNQVHIKRIILDLMEEDKTFAEALSKLEADPTCQNFSLISFLTLPIQRVTRFALLVDGVMKYVPDTDQSLQHWKKTIAVLRELAFECNEAAGKAEELEKMLLQRKNKSKKIDESDKKKKKKNKSEKKGGRKWKLW
uniref:DH domain-containing protein n=1 Tax=Timema cristinae TaxID=61476 RepID=A0A7R9GSX6_TIMCR|nr:unnamed protein product [Timema cristinae]